MLSGLIKKALLKEAEQTGLTYEHNELLFRSICGYMDAHNKSSDPPNQSPAAAAPPANTPNNRS